MPTSIKDMQLYTEAGRIFTELRARGYSDDVALDPDTLATLDQLHYHGTDALDEAIRALPLTAGQKVLEIGSGWGGPSRYLAAKTGAHLTAVELQEDYHEVGQELTRRAGLSDRVDHINADFHHAELEGQSFDAIVSWLALYHIPDRPAYLAKAARLLKPDGRFLAEDLVLRDPAAAGDLPGLKAALFANSLISFEDYGVSLERAGFRSVECQDMTESWTAFTRERLEMFLAGANAYQMRHGEEVYRAMESFYRTIAEYFSKGVIGGVRATANA